MIRALDEKAQEISTAMTARSAAIAETLDGGVAHFEERVVGRLVAVSGDLERLAAPSPKLLRPGREKSIKLSVFMPATSTRRWIAKQVTLGKCSRGAPRKSATLSHRRSRISTQH